MLKRLLMLLVTMLLATLIVSGCGDKKEKEEDKVVAEPEEEEVEEPEEDVKEDEEEVVEDEPEEKKEEEENTAVNSSEDFSELITYMEEATDGTAKVLYENNEAQVHNLDTISVSLDAYTLVELKDFHTNFAIPFNDQTDGGVIIAKYTVTNDSDEDAYYAPHFYMAYTGAQKAYGWNKDLIPEDIQISTGLTHTDDYLIKAGETVTGYYAYPFGQDHLEEALETTTVAVEIPEGQGEKDNYDSPIGKRGNITLSLNEKGAEKLAANKAFYEDKVTYEDMGEKKMLKEKEDINDSQDLRDVKVTLEGYQFTEFIPNEVEAPRFSNFDNGVVLLTIKLNLDNKGSENIGLNSMNTKLTVNDGSQWMLNEGMLLNYRNNDIIKANETGEWLQIFVLEQEQYEKIWKDKSFELEVGPLKDDEAKDISKGNRITFILPN